MNRMQKAFIIVALIAGINASYTMEVTGLPALHTAAKEGDIDAIKVLLDKGADINAQDVRFQATPLHFAIIGENNDIARILIDKGAFLDVQDDIDHTPLHDAVTNENVEGVKLLLDAGADERIFSENEDRTPLNYALNDVGGVTDKGPLLEIIYEFIIRNKFTPKDEELAETLKSKDEELYSEVLKIFDPKVYGTPEFLKK